MAWYRQYRPKIIGELDIVQVKNSLEAMMRAGKIPQSLIFAGPKGTGKTSASRILALLLNDPKNEELVNQLYFAKTQK
jgi:DNA polymerase III gamma/tau subunit